MLTIVVPGGKFWDEEIEKFLNVEETVLELEHSLVSLSKWESEFEKPFLGKDDKTTEEVIAYIKAMTLTPNVQEGTYSRLTEENMQSINAYLEAKHTATWFRDVPGSKRQREIVTSEIIYYWMTILNIPFECQYWNLNKLLTLIRVCNEKSGKSKKMTRSEILAQNKELNAQRKAQLGTKG